MSSQSKLVATISETAKETLQRFAASQGLEKDVMVEQALHFYMEARRDQRRHWSGRTCRPRA